MNRVKTGIRGLDQMLCGGFLSGAMVLVEGAPGTGKTSLGLQFLHAGASEYDEPGLLVTFEEYPQQLIRDAHSLGWNLAALEATGKLRVVYTSPEALLADFQSPDSSLAADIQRLRIKRVVIDSASHFREVTDDPVELRRVYRGLVSGLKREGVTVVFTAEDYHLLGPRQQAEAHGLAFLVDAIVLMRYVEIESGVQRAILVLKTRGSDHDKGIRQLVIDAKGMHVQSQFTGREGVLSGSPRRSLSRRAAAPGFVG